MIDKIKINLSHLTYSILLNDIENFGFFKTNNELNQNKFYNTIIKNYYLKFKEKKENLKNLILNTIPNSKDDIITITNKINNGLNIINNSDKGIHNHPKYITIRPTKETNDTFLEIEKNELAEISLNEFIRNIFNEYMKLPLYEREKIVFYDKYLRILTAIDKKKRVFIKTNRTSYDFDIYSFQYSKEETHNFLIGKSYYNNEEKISSIKLPIIKELIIINEKNKFTDDDITYINNCLEIGPEFISTNMVNAKIQFTTGGVKMFDKCYKDRPVPTSIDKETLIYEFKNNLEHLFFYFKQFGRHAVILEPIELRNKFIDFYTKAINAYKD